MIAKEIRVETTTTFSLLCPVCEKHRLSVILSQEKWCWNGHTLTPSIRFDGGFFDGEKTVLCNGHFSVINNEIVLSS